MIARPDQRGLFEVASGQLGYFTARQAAEQGFGTDDTAYHARQGRFIRELPGVYRLREYPDSPHGYVMAAWLAAGKDRSVVSHESALDLLDLSTVIPDAVHITVPRSRRNLPQLRGVRIHTTTRPIGRQDTVVREGIRVTSPVRTILDSAETYVGPDQIEMAVWQALRRGTALPEEFREAASWRSKRVAAVIDRALAGATGA